MKVIDEDHGHHHSSDHLHSHSHKLPESFDELRTMAIESLLIEKKLITAEDIDGLVNYFVNDIGPMNGAKVVAKAWVDPDFKQVLMGNGNKGLSNLGLENPQSELVVLENTPGIHHVVVCTLCSCYPWVVLGLPPTWYKSAAYRSRIVIDPRSVLKEFGVELDDSVEIRVVDSNADVRYLILPERPEGTEHFTEEELAAIVTRDSMIGTDRLSVQK